MATVASMLMVKGPIAHHFVKSRMKIKLLLQGRLLIAFPAAAVAAGAGPKSTQPMSGLQGAGPGESDMKAGSMDFRGGDVPNGRGRAAREDRSDIGDLGQCPVPPTPTDDDGGGQVPLPLEHYIIPDGTIAFLRPCGWTQVCTKFMRRPNPTF